LTSSASGTSYIQQLYKPILTHHSIALYGLILFYELTKEELKGRRPLAKFLAIKLIVIFTFYQGFIVRLEAFLP